MSVSSPLIKEIKEWTVKFLVYYESNISITDDNPYLMPFCVCLEKIFNKGLCTHYNTFGFVKEFDAWNWLENLEITTEDSLNYNYNCSLEYVMKRRNVLTNTGKLRLLIRMCLTKKCIHIPILQLMNGGLYQKYYYPNNSILGDEILAQIVLSVLMQCGKYVFTLDVANSSFLDLSWLPPRCTRIELVPCKNLGVSVVYVRDKAIVVAVQPASVAAEDGNISIGDVLDELNDTHICSSTKGKLNKIMRKSTGKPVTVKVIKLCYNDNFDFYPPLVPLLREVKLDLDSLQNKRKIKTDSTKTPNKSPGYHVTYVGSVSTGNSGDVKEIDRAIRTMLRKDNDEFGPKFVKADKKVCFEVGEIGVRVVDSGNDQVIFTHSYMEISSCGTVNTLKYYFAYIAGEQICNLAKDFTCYVYHCRHEDDIFTILESIGQGFHRTHFAV